MLGVAVMRKTGEDDLDKFPCPCCGYVVFDYQPGTHQRCPICRWEDDLSQLRFVLMPGSANTVSLARGQQNFADVGAAERRRANEARSPVEDETREPGWRPLDVAKDNVEEPCSGIDYSESYPTEDPTVLYYWRSTYWRRMVS